MRAGTRERLWAIKGGLVLAILIASMMGASDAGAIPAGAIAYWSFDDGTATDDVAGVHTGTLVGAVAPILDGISGGAMCFRCGSGYIEVPNSPAFDFGTGSFSVALWFRASQADYPPGFGGQMFQYNDNFEDSGELSNIGLRITDPTTLLSTIRDELDGAGQGAFIDTGDPVTDDEWHHLVLVRDAQAVGFQTYLDDVLVVDDPLTETGSIHFDNPGTLGANVFLGNLQLEFDGDLDEVVVYDRALDSTDVRRLFATPEPAMLPAVALATLLGLGAARRLWDSPSRSHLNRGRVGPVPPGR